MKAKGSTLPEAVVPADVRMMGTGSVVPELDHDLEARPAPHHGIQDEKVVVARVVAAQGLPAIVRDVDRISVESEGLRDQSPDGGFIVGQEDP